MKLIKKALSLLVCLALLSGLCILPAGAAGWGADYGTSTTFTISTADELKAFAGMVSGGKDFAGKTVTLAQDIALDPKVQWVPIGSVDFDNTETAFAGTFNGNSKCISGMSITCMTDDDPLYNGGMGLFGSVSGTVENLTLKGFQIHATVDKAGGVAGIVTKTGVIRNCTADGTIEGGIYESQYCGGYFGGIAGDNFGNITGCTAIGTYTGVELIGGIVGNTRGYFGTISISDCTNHASVTAKTQSGGGIAGASVGTKILNCRNDGAIACTGDAEGHQDPLYNGAGAGGIVGSASNQVKEISGCVNEGAVEGLEHVGGIVGGCSDKIVISGCTNYGTVSCTVRRAGGIAGNNNATVEGCLNIGAVSGKGQASAVGALVGYNVPEGAFPGTSIQAGTVTGSYWLDSSSVKGFGTEDGTVTACSAVTKNGVLTTPVGDKNTLMAVLSGSESIPTYTVTFTTDPGAAPAPITQVVGFSVELPDVAQHVVDKYTFSGWKSGEDVYQPGSLFNAAADATVTAVWAPPSGDPETQITGMPNPVVLPHGDITLEAPLKDTYSYRWQFSADAGGTWADVGANSTYVIRGNGITIASNGWLYRCEIGNQETGREPVYELSGMVALNVQKGAQAAPDSKLVYGGTERINGVTSAMEYQVKGAAVWTACPDGSMTGLSAGAYLVRYAETESLSASAPIEVTVSAYSGGGGGGGGSTPTPPPTVETNPDGSTTKTETAKDGTVTETTEHKDGTVQVVETKPDGTVTESVKTPDGLEAKAVTSPEGKVEAEVVIPAAKAEAGTVALPISELPVTKDADKAPVVTVKSGKPVTVAVPVAQAAPGMVAVIVNADGTEEIVTKSVLVDGALVVPLEAGATVKLVDKSVDFADAAQAAWAGDAIAFVSSHALFQGTGEGSFSPNQPMNRAMLVTVLHRLESKPQAGVAAQFADVDSGAYYTEAVAWASESGIVTGTGAGFDPDAPISREQLATILYRYMAKQGVQAEQGDLSAFADGGAVSPWAQEAMGYAVGAGLMTGKDGGVLDPQGTATRAEVAVVLQRLVEAMAQ